ncbi:MAG: sulfurtransferase [Cyanobacteria bacterium P01_F01_bin.86]
MTDYAQPKVLVDTQWLAEHLNDPSLRIVEVDMSADSCANAHIPGAIFWHVPTDLSLPNLRLNLDPIVIEELLSRSGISNETTVVAYGSYPAVGACIFWLLKLFGHQDVRVLNGGYQKWIAENRPVATELSTFSPQQYTAKPLDGNLRVLLKEVQAALSCSNQVLLDVRSIEEYRGESFLMKPPEGTERAGHIPGCIHMDHILTLNEDGTFKSFDELQTLYYNWGVTPDKEILPYCAIGARSAFVWFVLKYLLGYPKVRNYDGSWNEWSRLPDTPVDTEAECLTPTMGNR